MSGKPYEYLEHTADLFFRAFGKSLGECYGNAARAMFSAMIDPRSVDPVIKRTILLEANDLPALMHDYLSEILFLFETEGLVFRDFDVSVEKKEEVYKLSAVLSGEEFNKKKHIVLTDIKAVTYHGLKVEKRDGQWVAEVLCDI
ncbi:MAG: archease [Deltaproteobacteria bacterium]|nr:archease [Deltaproteobacteria bacterium]